jgi:phage baseplate assembly protein gpV
VVNLGQLFYRQIRDAEIRADRIYEAVIGIVVDNKDPARLSRVKVRFPSLPGNDSSWWATLVAFGAGKDRGWYFLPEINDEVLVMFEHGDIRRPMVIGMLWNGKDLPPCENAGKNEIRTIVSRAGSRIIFDDDTNTVALEDANLFGTIRISEDKIVLEAHEGDVCLQAPMGELNIVANELHIEGAQNFHIDTRAGVNLGADGPILLKGGTSLKVRSQPLNLNPGGVPGPTEVSAKIEPVPDPVGAEAPVADVGDRSPSHVPGDPAVDSRASARAGQGSVAPSGPPRNLDKQIAEIRNEHEIEVQVLDASGAPAANVYYELTLPDGTLKSGRTGTDGYIRHSGLTQAGDCKLSFPDLDSAAPKK